MADATFPRSPFTLASAPCSRARMRRALESREVVRVVRGAYVRSDVELTEITRAQAALLALGPTAVLCDRTAAWVLGVDCFRFAELDGVPRLESCVLRGHEPTERSEVTGHSRDLREDDIIEIAGVRVTSPLRTAADLLCLLPRREALAAADALMRLHGFTVRDLRRILVRYFRRRGVFRRAAWRRGSTAGQPLRANRGRGSRSSTTDCRCPSRSTGFTWTASRPTAWTSRTRGQGSRSSTTGRSTTRVPADRLRDEERRAWLRAHGWRVIVLTKHSFTERAIEAWIGELRTMLAN